MDFPDSILNALRTEDTVMLATILSTSGSTPASAFSKMLLKDGCRSSLGTVGGGCVEGDVLQEARRLYTGRRAAILTFHLTEDHLESGMLCGGSLDVLIEPVTKEDVPLLTALRGLREEGKDCVLATYLHGSGQIHGKVLLREEPRDVAERNIQAEHIRALLGYIPAGCVDTLGKVCMQYETRRMKLPDGELILEPVAGWPSLVIFGAGHVSRCVSRAASMVGFRVTVVDDRKEFANPERFPEAKETLSVEFSDAFERLVIKPSTYVVIVTRGHRSDEEILEQVIKTPARYIGMIGSRHKVLATYENLIARGVSQEALERVHAPIGIDIGAATAEEIGISIVAQLIHVRRGGSRTLEPKSDVMKSLLSEIREKGSEK